MSGLVSRVVVALVALPIVLGLVWLGGWWLFGLLVAAAIVGLHEYTSMTRQLRPVLLGGYIGVLAMLLGASEGGPGVAARRLHARDRRHVLPPPARGDAAAADDRDRVDPARRRLGGVRPRAHPAAPRLRGGEAGDLHRADRRVRRGHARLLRRPAAGAPQARPDAVAGEDLGRVRRGDDRGDRSRFLRALRGSRHLPRDLGSARAGRGRGDRGRARRPVRVGVEARHAGQGHRPAARRARRRARPRGLAALGRAAAFYLLLAYGHA